MSCVSWPIMYGSKRGSVIDGSVRRRARISNAAGRVAKSHPFRFDEDNDRGTQEKDKVEQGNK